VNATSPSYASITVRLVSVPARLVAASGGDAMRLFHGSGGTYGSCGSK
jgi:hypothetical protein